MLKYRQSVLLGCQRNINTSPTLAPTAALDRCDPSTGTFTRYRQNPDDPASLSHDAIRAVLVDSSGTLWVSTWGGGLDRLLGGAGYALTTVGRV